MKDANESRPYVSRDDLRRGFRDVGLEAGQHVVVHSSLSRFGWVEDAAEGVIDVLEEIITPAGTLVMPTYSGRLVYFMEAVAARASAQGKQGFEGTLSELYAELKTHADETNFTRFPFDSPETLWNRINKEGVANWDGWTVEPKEREIHDSDRVSVVKHGEVLTGEELKPNRMPVTVGIIPETFWRRPETRRSEQYSGSFTAWGAETDRILERHDNHSNQDLEDHPLYRLREVGGKIMLLGIDHRRNSTLHVAESAAIKARGVNVPQEFLGDFQVVDEPLMERGAQAIVTVGAARVRLCDTRELFDVVAEILDQKLRDGELTPEP